MGLLCSLVESARQKGTIRAPAIRQYLVMKVSTSLCRNIGLSETSKEIQSELAIQVQALCTCCTFGMCSLRFDLDVHLVRPASFSGILESGLFKTVPEPKKLYFIIH